MSFTSIPTFVDNTTPDASDLNSYVRDNLLFFRTKPFVTATNNAQQSVTAAPVTINFNTEIYKNVSGLHDTVTNNGRFIATKAGIWFASCTIRLTDPGATAYLLLYNNGTTVQYSNGIDTWANEAQDIYLHASGLFKLAINDYVYAAVGHNSGSAKNTVITDGYPRFSFVYLGEF